MKKWCLTLVAFLVVSLPAFAGEPWLRCGSKLVELGASMAEVLMRCGEPMMKNVNTTGSGNVRSEVWYYNGGDGNFNYTLTFHGMKLIEITRTNERGSGVADWYKAR